MPTMTLETVRQVGLNALRRDLGVVGMVRFLQQFEMGRGDYTADRWQWLPADADVDTWTTMIQQEEANAREQAGT